MASVLQLGSLKIKQQGETWRSLLELADAFGHELSKFVEFVVLGSGPDVYRPDGEQVALMSLHAAKVLDFPCVFIVGCENGLIPYSLSDRRPGDPEEE